MPLLPCFFNFRVLGRMTSSPLVNWLFGRPVSSGSGLPAHFASAGLRVEQVHLARPADHEQEDDALGLRLEVRLLRRERVLRGGRLAVGPRFAREQPVERDPAEPAAGVEQEVATRSERWKVRVHDVSVLRAREVVQGRASGGIGYSRPGQRPVRVRSRIRSTVMFWAVLDGARGARAAILAVRAEPLPPLHADAAPVRRRRARRDSSPALWPRRAT